MAASTHRRSWLRRGLGALGVLACGCATLPTPTPPAVPPQANAKPFAIVPPRITPAAHFQPAQPAPVPQAAAPAEVEDFVRLAVERNPRLARATFAIDAARGKHLQAGLYPNPELAANWEDIGDRTAAGGVLNVPQISQTIVTGGKLTLAQAVAAREVDQAALALLTERFAVIGSVRAAFYEVLTLQRRAEILTELLKLADEAVANGKALLDAKPARIARLDFIQLEVERERFRAELQAVQHELPAAYRRLAAVAGSPTAIPASIVGTFANLPAYDADTVQQAVLAYHPRARSARVGVERAQAALRRAEVEPIPNVTLSAGYIRQFENRSHDGAFSISMPVPVWNRNQGNIHAARAELAMAIQSVGQTENELAARVAAALQTYAAARERAAVYEKEIIPRAEETYKLSLTAFKGGQFEYLRVIQSQRSIAEARLEWNKSLGEAWRAAAELSGLLMEEAWPAPRR